MRIAVLLALFAAPLAAEERDGAQAGPLRWPDPRGTASGSRRSAALPVVGDIVEAWATKLPGVIEAPPVHWQGRAYLVCDEGGKRILVGVDLLDGRILARKRLPDGPRGWPVVWDDRVFIRIDVNKLGEYKLVGKGFNTSWRHRPDVRSIGDPVVVDNEIYVVGSDGTVLRLRPGSARTVWGSLVGSVIGRPAVYGDHVYVLSSVHNEGYKHPEILLHVLNRSDGEEVSAFQVAHFRGGVDSHRASIAVTENHVLIRAGARLLATSGTAGYARVTRRQMGDRVEVGDPAGLYDYAMQPSLHRNGIVALRKEKGALHWLYFDFEGRGRYLATRKDHPELFESRFAPTILGDVVYFGTWAADLVTLDILWRLPIQRIRYAPVPADRLVLVVGPAPDRLVAFRER